MFHNLVVPLAFGLLVSLAGLGRAQEAAPSADASADADSAQAELQAELDAMLRELHGDWGSEDPFRDGRPPDLLVVTSADVRGEVAPCG